MIDTAYLSAGTHVLTATATDSASATGAASVTVTVKATNDPPVAVDDYAYARAGSASVVDVLANDADPERDIAPHSVAAVTPGALGAVSVLQLSGGTAISSAAAGAGYDALLYRVCDAARQCSTAELTVAVADEYSGYSPIK